MIFFLRLIELCDVTNKMKCSRRSVANMASQVGGSHCGKSGGRRYCVEGGAGKVSCTNSQFTEGISINKFPDSSLEEERHKNGSSL